MCMFKSAICLRDDVFVPDYDSHERMLRELGIRDDDFHRVDFVRIELTPPQKRSTSFGYDIEADISKWNLCVEQDVLPHWWDAAEYEHKIRRAVQKWCDIHFLQEGLHSKEEGVWYVMGSADIKLRGSAQALLFGEARASVFHAAEAILYESSTGHFYDCSCASLFDNSHGFFGDDSHGELFDRATAIVKERANITAWDSSFAELYGNTHAMFCEFSKGKLHDMSVGKFFGHSSALLGGQSTGVFFNESNPTGVYDDAVCIRRGEQKRNMQISCDAVWELCRQENKNMGG